MGQLRNPRGLAVDGVQADGICGNIIIICQTTRQTFHNKGDVDARKISSCIPPSLPRPQRSSERERVCVYLYTFRGLGSCAKGCS